MFFSFNNELTSSSNFDLMDINFISSSSCCCKGFNPESFLAFLNSASNSKLVFSSFLNSSANFVFSNLMESSNISARSNSNGNWTFLKILDFFWVSLLQKNAMKCTVNILGNAVIFLVNSYSASAPNVSLCFVIVSFNPLRRPSRKKLVLMSM